MSANSREGEGWKRVLGAVMKIPVRSAIFLVLCTIVISGCMIVRKPTPQELSALDNPPTEVREKLDIFLPKVETWYAEVEAEFLASGRPLSSEEIKSAVALGVLEPEKVRVVTLEAFPMPKDKLLLAEAEKYGLGSWVEGGRSIGYVVFLKPRVAQHPEVLRHELVHVTQQNRMGRKAFLRRYLTELEMMGYSRSPLELEAYSKQNASK